MFNRVVYVGSQDGNLYAVNATTGAEAWSTGAGGPVGSSPAVALENTADGPRDVVYVGSEDGNVYALNASPSQTFVQLFWTFPPGDSVESSPGGRRSGLRGFRRRHRLRDQRRQRARGMELHHRRSCGLFRAVANGVVYVGSDDGNVYALNATTGAELWSFDTGGTVSSPAVADGTVYVGSGNGEVYALDAATGGELWSYDTSSGACKAGASSPAVARRDGLRGLRQRRLRLQRRYRGRTVEWRPRLSPRPRPRWPTGVVYAGSGFRQVYALSAATGAVLWSYATGGVVASSPAVADGVVYTGSGDDNVYAFDLSAGQAAPGRPDPGSLHPNHRLRPQQ